MGVFKVKGEKLDTWGKVSNGIVRYKETSIPAEYLK